MYTCPEDVNELERALGKPLEREMEYEIATGEFDMVTGSMCRGRAHDVTMFIRAKDDPARVVVIRKPFFPPAVFRAPSGAADRGEGLAAGAVREAKEETGLDVELVRYVARINARFTCEDRVIDWTTHVFEARETGGVLDPIDTVEIAEARWATLEELQGPIRQALLEVGWDLLRYRVALTDLVVEALREARA